MGGRRGVRGTREGGLSRCDINMVWILVFTAGLIWRELGFRSVMFCYFGVTQHMMWEEKAPTSCTVLNLSLSVHTV